MFTPIDLSKHHAQISASLPRQAGSSMHAIVTVLASRRAPAPQRRDHLGRNLSMAVRCAHTSSPEGAGSDTSLSADMSHGHVCSALRSRLHCAAVHAHFNTGMSAAHYQLGCIVMQSMRQLHCGVEAYSSAGACMPCQRGPATHQLAALSQHTLPDLLCTVPHATARPLAQQARHGQLARRPIIRHRAHGSSASGAGGCGRGRGRGRGRLLLGSLCPRALRVPARLEAHRCVLRSVAGTAAACQGLHIAHRPCNPHACRGILMHMVSCACPVAERKQHGSLRAGVPTRDTGSWL